MIDEKSIQEAYIYLQRWLLKSEADNQYFIALETLAAAYREKCEELKLEKKIRESYQDSARGLYEENDRLRSKMLGAFDYPTVIGGRA